MPINIIVNNWFIVAVTYKMAPDITDAYKYNCK